MVKRRNVAGTKRAKPLPNGLKAQLPGWAVPELRAAVEKANAWLNGFEQRPNPKQIRTEVISVTRGICSGLHEAPAGAVMGFVGRTLREAARNKPARVMARNRDGMPVRVSGAFSIIRRTRGRQGQP